MSRIITIWKKELKDSVRDRRTLISTIILPMLLMPVIIVGLGKLTVWQISQSEEQIAKVAVANESASADFTELLRQNQKIEIISASAEEARTAVKNKTIDLAVVLPDDFDSGVTADRQIQLEVYQNSLNMKSSAALARLSATAVQYNQLLLQSRLAKQNISPDVQNGLILKAIEIASESELGGFGLSYILPLFIVMWAVVGGQTAAVDISAGEKERKTLESLLLTPVSRLQIVIGKFMTVSTMALTSEILALGSMYAVFAFGGGDLFASTVSSQSNSLVQSDASGFSFSLQFQAVIIMFLVSILLVMLFSALNLSVAIFARSYKEAQSYIGPSYLAVILPVVLVNTLPGFEPTLGYFAIPIVNAVLLFKEVLIGVYDTGHILLTIAVMIAAALFTMYIASRIYQKEKVLFKD